MKSYQVERTFDLSPQFLIPTFPSPFSHSALVHSLAFLQHVIVIFSCSGLGNRV